MAGIGKVLKGPNEPEASEAGTRRSRPQPPGRNYENTLFGYTAYWGDWSPERGGIQLEVTQPVSGSGESHDSAPLASKLLLSPDTAQPEPDEDGLVQD